MKSITGVAVSALLAVASPAHAECMTDAAYQSVQIRDVETMLMVATLRCRLVGVDFAGAYNQFVRDKKVVLNTASSDMRNLFIKNYGSARAEGAYDDYMTKVANGFGGGNDGLNCQDYAAIVQAASTTASTREGVVSLANSVGSAPRLPWTRCGTSIASK